MNLLEKKCIPCERGVHPLTQMQEKRFLHETPEWNLNANKLLVREFKFKNFKENIFFCKQGCKACRKKRS